MKRFALNLILAAGVFAPPMIMGCDRTVSEEKTTEHRSDGTDVKKENKTVEKSDGTIEHTEQKTVQK
jgi:hypothetical protein